MICIKCLKHFESDQFFKRYCSQICMKSSQWKHGMKKAPFLLKKAYFNDIIKKSL